MSDCSRLINTSAFDADLSILTATQGIPSSGIKRNHSIRITFVSSSSAQFEWSQEGNKNSIETSVEVLYSIKYVENHQHLKKKTVLVETQNLLVLCLFSQTLNRLEVKPAPSLEPQIRFHSPFKVVLSQWSE